MKSTWIKVKDRLPEGFLRVRYRMRKHFYGIPYGKKIEDIGFFSKGNFVTDDPVALLPVVEWKPLEPLNSN